MTRGVVTGAPLGSYSTHSSPVPYSPTRLAFAPLSLPSSLFITVSPFPSSRPRTRESLKHTLSEEISSLEREREGGSRLMQISYSDFSPFFLFCSRGGVRFDRTQETVNRSLAVRVPVISRLRDTGTDGSHCILIQGYQGEILSLPRLECTGI